MQAPETYRDASAKFMAQAHTELVAGDLAQASEKGWAAAAQMTKAIAAQRDLPHTAHWHLHRVIDRLVAETGDAELSTLFHVASGLHINFYKNTRSAQVVEFSLGDIERLLDKLRPILELGDAP